MMWPVPIQFSHSVMSDSLQSHGLQHTRPPCPSPTPRIYSNPCPLSQFRSWSKTTDILMRRGCTVTTEERKVKTQGDGWQCTKERPQRNQSWVFIGRTDVETEILILWLPDAKNWLIWKNPDAGKDCRWEEKGTTEDKMVGCYHWLIGHEFE